MRPVFNPMGGPDTLVDKMLGNAYDTVKCVSFALPQIKHVSSQLEAVYNVANSLDSVVTVADNIEVLKNIKVLKGVAPALGSTTVIPHGVNQDKILGITVSILSPNGSIYTNAYGVSVLTGSLNSTLVLASDADAALVGGTITLLIHLTP